MGALAFANDNEAVGQGNRQSQTGSIASLANGDTLQTGFSKVTQVFVGNMGEGQAVTWSQDAGVITFAVIGGPVVNADLLIFGDM